jgi:TatD DNase family protein
VSLSDMQHPRIIDTHCHLDLPAFDPDRDQVIRHAREQGVAAFVVPGVTCAGWDHLLSVQQQFHEIHIALGLHPMFMQEHKPQHLEKLDQYLTNHEAVAVGEIGLDFYIPDADRPAQTALFCQQLEIATQHQLPVIIHSRKSQDAILQQIKAVSFDQGGIMHAFNGSLQQAQQFIDLGFKLGFGGMLTFERSSKLRKLATTLPLDALVLETDAPDMTVASHQGERNSPEYLPEVLQTLANIRPENIEQIAAQIYHNSIEVLRLPLAE